MHPILSTIPHYHHSNNHLFIAFILHQAFEMSHIIILFVAIAFIMQASFLLNFAVNEGNNFLRTSRTTHSELLEQYVLSRSLQ